MRRLLALAASGVLVFAGYVLFGLPSRGAVRELAAKNPGPTALMRQRAREARARKRTARVAQTWAPLSRVSRSLIQAVISSEEEPPGR